MWPVAKCPARMTPFPFTPRHTMGPLKVWFLLLRAMFVPKPILRLRTWPYANNWPSSSTIADALTCAHATASSGSGFLGAGPTGDPCF